MASAAPDAHRTSNDFWATAFDAGTSSTCRFHGPEGLRRLTGPFQVSSPVPTTFQARLTRVQLDHVAVAAFETTASSAVRSAAQIAAFPTPVVSFIAVADGAARVSVAGASFSVAAGECLVLDSRDPVSWEVDHEIKLLQSVVGVEHVPILFRIRGGTVPVPFRRTLLSSGFVGFISSILRTTAMGRQARGEYLVHAIADLQSAVLAEAQQLASSKPDGPGLRSMLEQYIEASYHDPDLDPSMLAAAFDVSVRQVHAVFNDGSRTLARFIRDRRLVAAAVLLRTEPGPVKLSDVARQVGFRNVDSFGAAFRHRFGMTLTDYRAGGHDHLG